MPGLGAVGGDEEGEAIGIGQGVGLPVVLAWRTMRSESMSPTPKKRVGCMVLFDPALLQQESGSGKLWL